MSVFSLKVESLWHALALSGVQPLPSSAFIRLHSAFRWACSAYIRLHPPTLRLHPLHSSCIRLHPPAWSLHITPPTSAYIRLHSAYIRLHPPSLRLHPLYSACIRLHPPSRSLQMALTQSKQQRLSQVCKNCKIIKNVNKTLKLYKNVAKWKTNLEHITKSYKTVTIMRNQ